MCVRSEEAETRVTHEAMAYAKTYSMQLALIHKVLSFCAPQGSPQVIRRLYNVRYTSFE